MQIDMLWVLGGITASLCGLGMYVCMYVGVNRGPEPPDRVDQLKRELAELSQRVNLLEAATGEQIREPK